MALTLKIIGAGQVTSTNGSGASQKVVDYGANAITKSVLVQNIILVNVTASAYNALLDVKVQKGSETARYILKNYDLAQNARLVLGEELTLYLNSAPPDSVTLVAKSKTNDEHANIDYVISGVERDI
jgi:hypothetical protein